MNPSGFYGGRARPLYCVDLSAPFMALLAFMELLYDGCNLTIKGVHVKTGEGHRAPFTINNYIIAYFHSIKPEAHKATALP